LTGDFFSFVDLEVLEASFAFHKLSSKWSIKLLITQNFFVFTFSGRRIRAQFWRKKHQLFCEGSLPHILHETRGVWTKLDLASKIFIRVSQLPSFIVAARPNITRILEQFHLCTYVHMYMGFKFLNSFCPWFVSIFMVTGKVPTQFKYVGTCV
jgi:hypothetical protein